VATDGHVECWGYNLKKEWFDKHDYASGDPRECGYRPTDYIDIGILGSAKYTYVSAGATLCAIREDGKIVCWGMNCLEGYAQVPKGMGPD